MIFILHCFLLCYASTNLGSQLSKYGLIRAGPDLGYSSPFQCPQTSKWTPSMYSGINIKQILRTICCLDCGNPYLRITREGLLDRAMAHPQLDADRILSLFTDGMGKLLWNKELSVLKSGGTMIFNVFAILDAVIALRKNRPADCPIPRDKLDELLELLLIMELSASSTERDHSQHANNKAIIEGMEIGDRRFLTALAYNHAWTVEVRKEPNGQYLITYLNSGQGLQTHHRKMIKRYEYFAQYRLSLEEIAKLEYFKSKTKTTLDMYPKSGRINSPISATDFIGAQKQGTCHVKGLHMALKWFFRGLDPTNASYLWWKAWHLKYRIPKIKELLHGRSASPVINDNSRYPLSTLIIHHHVYRLREAANNPPSVLTDRIMRLLDVEEGAITINTIQPAGLVDRSIDRLYLNNDQLGRLWILFLLIVQPIVMAAAFEMDSTLFVLGIFYLIQVYVVRSEVFRLN